MTCNYVAIHVCYEYTHGYVYVSQMSVAVGENQIALGSFGSWLICA